ncbi:MAG TPA: MerR family transcriptional regulator [Candidatus Sulfotelmatobacter sp.]
MFRKHLAKKIRQADRNNNNEDRNKGSSQKLGREKMGVKKSIAGNSKSSSSSREEILIPDKLYFRIGEVATLCRLPAYVLRFWETEFAQLKPVKSSTGQRMYRRRDVESVLHIKQLLYEKGFTISGARQQLRAEIKSDKTQSTIPFPMHSAAELQHIRQGLHEILNVLNRRTG